MSKDKNNNKKNIDPVILNAAASESNTSAALRAALAILGIGVAAGATLVLGMDQIMKRIFVSEPWPNAELEKNDWAGEDLE